MKISELQSERVVVEKFKQHASMAKILKVKEEGVAEAGPFSYGAKKPRQGSVADLAAKKRKEQEKGKQPSEPKDQMVGNAKVTKGVTENSSRNDMVGFSVDTERAYQAVMARFGDHIEHNQDSGIMYVPSRLWPSVEQTAHDADGIGATEDHGNENPEHYGVTEGNLGEVKHFNTSYGTAGGRNEKTGKMYKHPDQIKQDRIDKMVRDIAVSDASPEHKKAAIDALMKKKKKGVDEASLASMRDYFSKIDAGNNLVGNISENDHEEYQDKYDWDVKELQSGDYVRDEQEGPNGEVFKMRGHSEERRVRIEDKDGRGWYISTSRLVRVADNDPAIAEWFGGNVDESDPSGIIHAAKHLNKSFLIKAAVAEGGTKTYRVKAQSERVAIEKFKQHASMAKILSVKEEGANESYHYTGSADLSKFVVGKEFEHGMLGTVTVVKVGSNGDITVKAKTDGKEVKVSPLSLH